MFNLLDITMSSLRYKLHQEGFFVLDDFFTPAECDEMIEAAQQLSVSLTSTEESKTVFSTKKEQQLNDDHFMESNDKISAFYEDKALDSDGNLTLEPQMALNKIGHALHLLHPIFRCYTYCHRVKSVCSALGLLDPAVVQSMFIFKNPGVGSKVVAHQDATYLYTVPIPPVGFWIALEDATIENGCLCIVSGSHNSGLHRRLLRSQGPDGKVKLVYDSPAPVYPESNFIPIPVKKGSCIVLHGLVVHKSAANKSAKSRPAYTFHVIERKNNRYSQSNWLQEGVNAPFCNLYRTHQLM